MQRREQYLLIGLVAAVLLWQGGKLVSSTFLDPLWKNQDTFEKLQQSIADTNKELVQLAQQSKNLGNWKRRSLPPDPPVKNKQRPDALNAQRLYQDWLLDLAELSGFEQLKVSPDRRTVVIAKGQNQSEQPINVCVAVVVKIDAEAHFEQLCRFLDRFYRTDLLHRVTSLRIQSRESEGDPILTIALEAEGLAILDSPQNRRLFPQTTLEDELAEDATTLLVSSVDGFPKEPGFLVRIKNEFLKVTGIEATTLTVERAQDATSAASYPAGAVVELTPGNPDHPLRTAEQIKQLLDSNIFVKPAPPVQYKPKLAPLGEKTLVRGKPIEFTIVVTGYDPSKGRPEFALVEPIVPGSRIDKSNGRFSWAPSSSQKAGKYAFKFEFKHPSVASGRMVETVNISLREPNTAPKFATRVPAPVYIGRKWQFKPEATDAETSADKLTWKLGEGTPAGLEIDAKTGELTWSPDDSAEVGEATVQIVASDDGNPPLSATQALKLKVQDDAAVFTYLTTIFVQDGNARAILYDRSQNKSMDLKLGSRFSVADVQGTVTKIDRKHLLYTGGDATHRLDVGQSVRESIVVQAEPVAPPAVSPPADATQPVNAPSSGRE